MKQYAIKEMNKILKLNGYYPVRQKGSHKIWSNGETIISVPSVTLKGVVANKIIKENKLIQ